jgi:hypothetical protein
MVFFTFNPVGVGLYVFHNSIEIGSIGFTYGYSRFTPLGLGIDVDAAHPEGVKRE